MGAVLVRRERRGAVEALAATAVASTYVPNVQGVFAGTRHDAAGATQTRTPGFPSPAPAAISRLRHASGTMPRFARAAVAKARVSWYLTTMPNVSDTRRTVAQDRRWARLPSVPTTHDATGARR